MNPKLKKYTKRILPIVIAISLIFITLSNMIINENTENKIFDDLDKIPQNKVGLLLGTAKFLKDGRPNLYFTYRIQATAELYKSGKISRIIISGDNSRKEYNEPQDMKDELVRLGIPTQNIYLDYAGFRTYDSVFRIHAIFGQDSFTIISQKFHNQRAIYIASALKLNAVGFNAKDVDTYNGFKTKVREKFARAKVFIDLIFNKKPKFLGEKIKIN